ncbi:hypothetical protein V2J09_015570 [Rumex salicifolius]
MKFMYPELEGEDTKLSEPFGGKQVITGGGLVPAFTGPGSCSTVVENGGRCLGGRGLENGGRGRLTILKSGGCAKLLIFTVLKEELEKINF